MFRIQGYGSEGLQLKVELAGSVVPHARMWLPMPGHTLSMSCVHLLTALFFFSNFILVLSVLGLHCCTWAFSSCSKRGLLFVVVLRLLIVVASLVAEHRLWSAGSVAMVHRLSCSIWDLPEPGIKPVSPALAGGFLTTFPGKSYSLFLGKTSN